MSDIENAVPNVELSVLSKRRSKQKTLHAMIL